MTAAQALAYNRDAIANCKKSLASGSLTPPQTNEVRSALRQWITDLAELGRMIAAGEKSFFHVNLL